MRLLATDTVPVAYFWWMQLQRVRCFVFTSKLPLVHNTGVAVVPIRVPMPITTNTRSSIHFIEEPKKSPLVGELIRPSSHGEDGGEEWIKRSVSPHRMAI